MRASISGPATWASTSGRGQPSDESADGAEGQERSPGRPGAIVHGRLRGVPDEVGLSARVRLTEQVLVSLLGEEWVRSGMHGWPPETSPSRSSFWKPCWS
jgi:hypothetical protein